MFSFISRFGVAGQGRVIKYFSGLLLLAVPVFSAQAQVISGYVRDSESVPISYATVVLQGSTQGTVTDSTGFFRLAIAQRDNPVLVVRCVGYEEVQHNIMASEFNHKINIKLQLKDNFLNTVVVTGTRSNRTLKDVPVLTKVLSSADLQDAGAVTALDALESLLPGVHFDPNPMGDNIQVQGLDNSYILVMVDGERMVPERNENVNFARLNVADIERIEVINGASSVLYGSNAIGAVINIITKKVERPLEGYLQGRYSNYNTIGADAGFGFQVKDFSSKTSFNMKSTDGYDLSPETPQAYTVRPNSDYSVSQILQYRFNPKWSVGISGRFYSHETLNPPSSLNSTHRLERNYTLSGKASYSITDRNTMVFSGHSDMYKSYIIYEKMSDSTSLNADYAYTTFRVTDTWLPVEKFQLVSGAEYNRERMYAINLLGKDKNDASSYNNNLFMQGDFKIIKGLEGVVGLRLTQHSEFGVYLSPKASLMYKWNAFRFRVGISNGFKAPTLKELYYNFDHQGIFDILGNPDLKPEESWYGSASAEYINEDIDVSATMYNNYITDKINSIEYINTTTGRLEMRYENVADVRVSGVDAFVQWRFLKLFYLKGGYAFTHAVDKATGLQLAGNSKNNATMALTFKYNDLRIGSADYPLTLVFSGRALSPRIYQEISVDDSGNETIVSKDTQAYSIWKVMYTQKIPVAGCWSAEVQFGIDNLFDYVDNKTYSLVNPGRTYSVMAKISF